MKQNFDKFPESISTKQAEMVLRDLSKRLEDGEIRSEEQLALQLQVALDEVSERGTITAEIPVSPTEVISSKRFRDFFQNLIGDINVLFKETDTVDQVMQNMMQMINAQIQNLEFTIGQLNSELIERQVKAPPGSGWSMIIRDSFERGYGQLLDRSELPYDLFQDTRTGINHDKINPIKSDVKIDKIAKKVVLPETDKNEIGFSNIQLNWVSGTTPGDIPFETDNVIFNAIDNSTETFWSHIVANSTLLLGDPVATVTQVAGIEDTADLIMNLSGLNFPNKQSYYVHMLDSGVNYLCYSDLSQSTNQLNCQWDLGSNCQWQFNDFYTKNCTNSNCSRYKKRLLTISGTIGTLEDGYKYDTGATFEISGTVSAGQIWQIGIEPSGTIGAVIEAELEVSRPGGINWIELMPVAESPFILDSIEYSEPQTSGRIQIASGINVLDQIRLDFNPIEAEKLYLTMRQESSTNINSVVKQDKVALSKLRKLKDSNVDPDINELYNTGIEVLMYDYLPNGPARTIVENRINEPQELNANLYQFGLFNISCGYTSYADTAVAVTKAIKATTPLVFAVKGNIENNTILSSGIATISDGTIEFDIIKENYDINNTLINIDEFNIPQLEENGYIKERIFLNSQKTGQLRFAVDTINKVNVVSLNRELTTSEYEVSDSSETVIKSTITISRSDVSETSVVIVEYTPKTDVYLNNNKTITIKDNSTRNLSFSDTSLVITTDKQTANRDIAYSIIYMRLILRRNDADVYTTPSLRDYQLYISEADPGRFF